MEERISPGHTNSAQARFFYTPAVNDQWNIGSGIFVGEISHSVDELAESDHMAWFRRHTMIRPVQILKLEHMSTFDRSGCVVSPMQHQFPRDQMRHDLLFGEQLNR